MVSLKEIVRAARNNINTRFIVLEKGRVTSQGGGQNRTCLALVADESASVHFQLWNEECDAFRPGNIVHLSNGIFSYSRSNCLVLRAGKSGKVEKVGEFTMAFVESPNVSQIVWISDLYDSSKYVQEYVIATVSGKFSPLV
ncbi:hypothetical protein L1987_69015 [Smallanthus sonchifolius]|uniref:Uncharacterized protein n=1 Tax=Smallanthus sonchifolius TaxID=185202 RepID=A0ACB9B9R1_9ASTR|nr:hypothetical protein L1987_69015 [Smallanthus sonchifolius]